jgi:hypothetical protein
MGVSLSITRRLIAETLFVALVTTVTGKLLTVSQVQQICIY